MTDLRPALTLLLSAAPLAAQDLDVVPVPSVLETATLTEEDGDADADDPAFWVDPEDPARTLVVTAVKNGGIRVYDLAGAEVQAIAGLPGAGGEDDPDGRINNVDVVYGMALADGARIDVVLASDRGLDVLRVFRVDAEGLSEITAPDQARAFPLAPDPEGGADLDNPLPEQMTIYGIAGWADAAGTVWAVGTQRTDPRLGIFRLTAQDGGTVSS
jgi:myo-inositol-hexaphosphate 3-phosphohydrolase